MNTLDASQAFHIRKEQVYLLYSSSLHAAIATAIAAAVLVFIQWTSITHTTLLLWLSFTAVSVTARIAFHFAFQQKQPTMQAMPFWETSHVFLTIASGLIWGSAGIFLLPENNFEYQAATVVALAGMAAGSITIHSVLRAPAFIFLFLIMMPLTINLCFESTRLSLSIALICLVYMIFLAHAANRLYQTHLQNITFRLQSISREKSLQTSEKAQQETAKILEMIARGAPASDVYDAIALLYESKHPGMRCSLLELKGNQLLHGGAPSLPETYCEAINSLFQYRMRLK